MEVSVIEETGYNSALYGFSLSYKDRVVSRDDWWGNCFRCDLKQNGIMCDADNDGIECNQYSKEKYSRQRQIQKTATANSSRDKGHNKFLEHCMVWLDVEASIEWWKQYDTYRVGVSKQSESTMHTLDRRDIVLEDFDIEEEDFNMECISDPSDIGGTNPKLSTILGIYCTYLNFLPPRLKSKLLPQGYKQRREIVLSYKVLRHIIVQRHKHKLPDWIQFIDEIYKQVEHPELLPDRKLL